MAKIDKKLTSDKYQIADNTFFAVPKDNPKDLVQKEIGDSKTKDEFLPQQKIQRWDNECNVSVRLVHDELNPTVETIVGTPAVGKMVKGKMSVDVPATPDKIVWKGEKVEAHFYDIENEEHPEGASEFEVVLLEKPKTNVVQFTLVDKDVEYFKQTEERKQLENGDWNCAENVPGSYAIYAKTPKTNLTGGKEYKCGKVGHIYRPKIIDSVGTGVWGDLHIEKGILSVTIPQDFLDKAVYPVRHAAGLTFGYTTAGASSWGAIAGNVGQYSKFLGQTATLGAGTWVLSSISAALKNNPTAQSLDLYGMLWKKDGVSSGVHSLVASNESTSVAVGNSSYNFYTITGSSQPLPAQAYILEIAGDGLDMSSANYCQLGYDSAATSERYYDSSSYTGANQYTDIKALTTWSSAGGTGNYKVSIYATYTAGGGSTAPTVTTQAVSAIASTTATGNGNVTADGGATVTERGVCWGTSTNPTIAGSHAAAAAGGTGAFTASITSLSAKTHYYVRAYATNSVGTSYGDNVEFNTSGDFVIADVSSTPTVENIAMTQAGGTFAIADLSSTPTIENVVLVFNGGTFVIADLSSTPTIGNIDLIFNGTFSVDGLSSTPTVENVVLAQASGEFSLEGLSSTPTIENIVLVFNGGTFIISDTSSTPTIENVSLIFNGTFAIDGLSSTPTIENITLVLNSGEFIVADLSATPTIEEITLVLNGTFAINDLTSTPTIGNVVLELASGLFQIADISSTPTIDNITISFEGIFGIDDLTATPTIEDVVLAQAGGEFIVAGLSSTPTIENITIQFQGTFGIDSLTAQPIIENISLELSSGIFVINDLTATPTIQNITLEVPTNFSDAQLAYIDKRIIMWINALSVFIICFWSNSPPF